MFQLDFRDSRPLYEQIKEKMKTLIISGVLEKDEQLPSIRELAQSLTINPNTIHKAYKELETEGFIYSIRAKGSFVAPQDLTISHQRRDELKQEFKKIVAELKYLNEPSKNLMTIINTIYKKKEV